MSRPTDGQDAPDFTLPSASGEAVTLSALRGKPVVLYFYPKDDTPGCTTQACSFRDLKSEFDAAGAVILGVSKDSVDSHGKFTGKFGLNFPLLADTNGSVCVDYGVWVEKTNYGKTYMGIERTTFLIDAEGKIAKVFPKVKVDGHGEKLLEAVRALARK